MGSNAEAAPNTIKIILGKDVSETDEPETMKAAFAKEISAKVSVPVDSQAEAGTRLVIGPLGRTRQGRGGASKRPLRWIGFQQRQPRMVWR